MGRRLPAAVVLTGVLAASAAGAAPRLPGIPAYAQGYKGEGWLKVNGKPIPNRSGTAHPGVKNVYVNRARFPAARKFTLPYGTILVKEAVSDKYVSLIAVMRKVKGANPKNGDWVWGEYTRSGPKARFKLFASGAVCWGCHQQVVDRDYVFTKK